MDKKYIVLKSQTPKLKNKKVLKCIFTKKIGFLIYLSVYFCSDLILYLMINAKINMLSYKKVTYSKKSFIYKFLAVLQTALKVRKEVKENVAKSCK